MKTLRIALLLLFSSLAVQAQTSSTSKLTGTIYDAYGAVIVGAKVTAVASGKTFNAVSDGNGVYVLVLPFTPWGSGEREMAKYDITVVGSRGFKSFQVKGYAFAPGYRGSMRLDIALDVERIVIVD
jgi:hypothetical protein